MKLRKYRRILSVLWPIILAGVEALVEALDLDSDGGRKITRAEWEGIAQAMWEALVDDGLAAIDAAHLMGITLQFHNHEHTMTTDGRVFVKMLRNCFAQAIPYREGEIASFSPKIAFELINNRSAEAYAPPAQKSLAEVVETAESRVMKAAESAVVTTAKGKARK